MSPEDGEIARRGGYLDPGYRREALDNLERAGYDPAVEDVVTDWLEHLLNMPGFDLTDPMHWNLVTAGVDVAVQVAIGEADGRVAIALGRRLLKSLDAVHAP